MKRISLLFALSIVLLSFGLANAVQFDVEIEAGKQFTHPVAPGGPYYMGNTAMYLDILVGGDGAGTQGDLGGYSETHQFYSTNGDGTPIIWGSSGADLSGALDRMNGWEASGSYWGMLNDVLGFSWDGSLPDTMNHTTASLTGMTDSEPLLTRFRFYLTVPTAGTDQSTDIVEICVDQAEGSDPTYDWLFPFTADFGGPYCFEFLTVPNLPPEIDPAPPLTMSNQHDVNFTFSGTLTDDTNDPVTGVNADIGIVVFTPGSSSFSWSLDQPCDWAFDLLSHSVTFTLEDNVNGHMPGTNTYNIALTTLNTAPVIAGDCGIAMVAGINKAKMAYFTSTDANVGDVAIWSVVSNDDPNLGPYGVVGGVFTYTPDADDEGDGPASDGEITFTVTVTDCAGATSSCDIDVKVISQEPFFFAIEAEDGTKGPGTGVYLGHHAYVDVTQTQGTEHNFGFDFLISYDNSALALMGVFGNPDIFDIPGQYEWEYFTWRFVGNCGGACPSGLLQVVAIADQNDGMHTPVETIIPAGTVLFTMDFMVTNDYNLECQFVPISFFWRDCTDNSIAMLFRSDPNPLNIIQAISRDVFGYNGSYFLITDPNHGFPTYYGAQAECLLIGPDKYNVDFIDFFNGGIKIICSADIDDRGDINLNGVANEIADAVVFTNYFIYGMPAFTINEEGQKAATDVNADGIPLSVADLVYLIRVVIGDALPIAKLNPNMVEANFGHNGQLITANVEVGAALFVLEGNVNVNLAQGASHMQIKSDFVNGNTRVLVYSFERNATFSGNVLNTEGKVISVEAADYDGSALKTVVLPTSFSVTNYPNPFNSATTISMALPKASNWNLAIYNVAGQKVAEFSGFAEAGTNNVIWNSPTAASGIYFYKVTTDEGSMTKKMVLLK